MKSPIIIRSVATILMMVPGCKPAPKTSPADKPTTEATPPAAAPPHQPPSAPKEAAPALSLAVLEAQFGKDWQKVDGAAGGDEKTHLYIWSAHEPQVTAVQQQDAIPNFTAVSRDAGGNINAEKLLGKFSYGFEWREKGSIETPLGRLDLRVRADGKLAALSSSSEITFLIPEELTRRYPRFTSQFLGPDNRNKINLRFVREGSGQ